VEVDGTRRIKNQGIKKAMPVRTAEDTRHRRASSLEGKVKNHPVQCIPPNTAPVMDNRRELLSSLLR